MKNYLAIVLITLLFAACSNTSVQPSKSRVLKDALNRSVHVPEEVYSVIALRAGALRMLLYCDAKEMLVGIEEHERRAIRPYLTAFPELRELPVIGPAMGGDAELILHAQPDVIFMTYTTIAEADALQKKTGIPVVAIACSEFATERDALFHSLRLIAEVIHKQAHVEALISYVSNSIEELKHSTAGIPQEQKPSVYIGGVSYSGAHGICSTQPYYPPFLFTHSHNLASTIDEKHVSHVKGTYIDKEQLLKWNPDFLFLDQSGMQIVSEELRSGSTLHTNLKAVQEGAVFVLQPYNNYATNYEMALLNAWYVATILYPEQFQEIDMQDKALEIIRAFFGEDNALQLHDLGCKRLTKTDFDV